MGPRGARGAKLELRRKGAFPSWSLGTRLNGVQLYYALPPGIIPGAGVEPIFRLRHQPGADRIVMQVIDFLAQHFFGNDLLGMEPFLPDLVITRDLGRLLIILELVQNPSLLILRQAGDDLLGGVAFKIPNDTAQFITGGHQVQMVVQDDVGIDLQAFMLTAKLEGVEEQVEIGLSSEEGNPLDHRAGEEVRDACFSDGVAAAPGARGLRGGEAEIRRKTAFPSGAWERD